MAATDLAVSDRGVTTRHTEGEVEFGLRAMALTGFNARKARAMCKEAGFEVNHETLRNWCRNTFPTRWREIQVQMAPEIDQELIGKLQERTLQLDDAQHRLIRRLNAKVNEISPDVLPRAVQAISQAKDSNLEKRELLRGRPTEIKETRTVEELVAVLKRVDVLRVEHA